MANIPISVTIDPQGNITCPNTSAKAGDQVTWSPTGGTISNIIPGNPSPFANTPQAKNGIWSATIVSSGDYAIWDPQGKQKSPRITVVVPETAKKH